MQSRWSLGQRRYDAIIAAVKAAQAAGIFVVSSSLEETSELKFHGLDRREVQRHGRLAPLPSTLPVTKNSLRAYVDLQDSRVHRICDVGHEEESAAASAAARSLASLGASQGGKASADALTPEERVARAKAAIAVRWAKRPKGKLPIDHAAVMARLQGKESVVLRIAPGPGGARRRNAIHAKLRVRAESADAVTIGQPEGTTSRIGLRLPLLTLPTWRPLRGFRSGRASLFRPPPLGHQKIGIY